MASIPGYCPHCGHVFQSNAISMEFVQNATIRGHTNCPKCGKKANLVQGTFNEAGRGIEIVSAPPITHAVFDILKEIAERAQAGELSAEEAFGEMEKVAPSFASYLRFLFDAGIPVLGLLVALVALYLQFSDSQSSDAFEAEALKLMRQQTEIMEIIKDRTDIVYGDRIYDERAAPTEPKADPKTPRLKKKSERRKEVRKLQKQSLIAKRRASGRKYRGHQ